MSEPCPLHFNDDPCQFAGEGVTRTTTPGGKPVGQLGANAMSTACFGKLAAEELSQQWFDEAVDAKSEHWPTYVASRGVQWGADQRLEAVERWLYRKGFSDADVADLRAALQCSAKPPSLAEKGLEVLNSGNVEATAGAADLANEAGER